VEQHEFTAEVKQFRGQLNSEMKMVVETDKFDGKYE
jgi:hypothetical protein